MPVAAAVSPTRMTQREKDQAFKGDSGQDVHQRNFVDGVMANDRKILNAEVQIGHQSTAWCNLADVALRSGKQYSHDNAVAIRQDFSPGDRWSTRLSNISSETRSTSEKSKLHLSPTLEFDGDSQKFVGSGSG